ncbi:hypothetical protein EDB89DRAFT_2234326 [Lactarius sanguifluus]|nr:hypothetical protein EDB89DRAFT_2234326 [Lactarius sanguifluus]
MRLPSSPSDPSSGATSFDATSHISKMTQVCSIERLSAQCGSCRPATTIGMLPDNVLLEIFDYYRTQSLTRQDNVPVWPWHLLVHVCRKWRQIIFESPLRLSLQILCTHRTPFRKHLSTWPVFPIAISYHPSERPLGQGNVIDALEHPDRVCYISLDMTVPQLGEMATAMQKPFPVLIHLDASLDNGNAPALPANFLGGSAPCLQTIHLHNIPFPALPSLLLSASHLVKLELHNIPPAGYISPEAMVASLAALPKLETFIIEFQSAISRPDRIHLPPVTRTILPALTYFEFQGASEYLEDFVARIDSPQLDQICTVYLNQIDDIQVAQLSEFIDRSVGPKSNQFKIAHVVFYNSGVAFIVACPHHRLVWSSIFCKGVDWQVSRIAQVLGQFSAALCNVGHLKLRTGLNLKDLVDTDDIEWPRLLCQFPAAQTLHISRNLATHVALALEDITAGMVTGVLPSLKLILIEGQPASSIEKFVTARRISGRPVTVIDTETELNRGLAESYVSK